MLEGLEATEVRFLELKSVIDYRIEAEYFSKKFLLNDEIRESIPNKRFSECFSFVNGRPYNSDAFRSSQEISSIDCNDYPIQVAKIGDVTNKRDVANWDAITLFEFEEQKGSFLLYGDILMTLTGDPPDVGKVHFFCENFENATWNQRVAKINIKNYNCIENVEYAYTLLSTNFCRTQIERYAKGIRQRNLGNDGLDAVAIPLLSSSLQVSIKNIVINGLDRYKDSKRLYSSAESYLLECLGMTNFAANEEAHNVKTLKDSFLRTGRMDAEYYMPRFDDYARLIKSYDGGCEPLGDVCTSKSLSESFMRSGRLDAEYYQPKYDRLFSRLNRFPTATIGELAYIRKSIEPGSEAYQANGIPFVRVADLSKFGLSEPAAHLDGSVYGDTLRPRKDTILLTKDGSVGIAYKAEQDLDVITSGAILHLTVTSPQVLPDYLTLVLNSIVVKMQAERDAGGSIIQHWKPSEIEQVVIPILPMPIQKELTAKLQHSFALRSESQTLLQEAKSMVEAAIDNKQERGNLITLHQLMQAFF